jgi:hypothetical protein
MVRVPSAEVVGWRPTSPSLCLSVTPVLHHRGPLIAGHNFLFTIAFLSDTAIAFDTTNLGKYLFHGHGDTKKHQKLENKKSDLYIPISFFADYDHLRLIS